MNRLLLCAFCVSATVAVSGAGLTQDVGAPPQPPVSDASRLSTAQIDQLVAPVALYPDPLLADVLTASTYPLEVIDADRWAVDPQNEQLSGDDLTAALDGRNWDPSVRSLVPFPQVLQLMDGHLDWMEMLGEAFLAQPADVMDAVQRLRQRAQRAGNLSSNGEETVTDQDDTIAISPPADLIYVPQYDPWCAFGDWSDPLSPPYYFSNWSGYCEPAEYGVEFNPGIAWPFPFWGWAYFDWHHHRVLMHPDLYRQFHPQHMPKTPTWQHDPQHREGVPYRDPQNARVFGQTAAQRQSFRALMNASSHQMFRSAPPIRDGSSGQFFHAPLRRTMPRTGAYRSGPGRVAIPAGRARIAHGRGL